MNRVLGPLFIETVSIGSLLFEAFMHGVVSLLTGQEYLLS